MYADRIFFLGLVFLSAGVASASLWPTLHPLAWCLALGAMLMAWFSVFPSRFPLAAGFFFCMLALGWWVTVRELDQYQSLLPIQVQGEARVLSDPEPKSFYQAIRLHFTLCESRCPSQDILWQAPLTFSAVPGERLRVECALTLPENFSKDFDYRMSLAKDGIGFLCIKAAHAEVLGADVRGRLTATLYGPKHVLENALSRILPEPEAGLSKGLLLGGTHYLPEDVNAAFQRVGLSHVVAVSGYNITIITDCFLLAGLFFGLWRKQALWVALIGITLFIVMIGAPASAVRAGIMAGCAFAALQIGRVAKPLNALAGAAALMLLLNPLLLRYDIGFQLSFLATLAIVMASPWAERWLAASEWEQSWYGALIRKLFEVVFLTCVVELFVLPIILFSFHAFSPFTIFANFILLLVPFAMAFAFIAALAFQLWPGLHLLFAGAAYALLFCMTRFAEWLSHLWMSSITVGQFSAFYLALWYAVLGGVIFFLERKRKAYAHAFH